MNPAMEVTKSAVPFFRENGTLGVIVFFSALIILGLVAALAYVYLSKDRALAAAEAKYEALVVKLQEVQEAHYQWARAGFERERDLGNNIRMARELAAMTTRQEKING